MNIPVLAANTALTESYLQMKPALILLVVILAVLSLCCIVFTLISAQVKSSRNNRYTQKIILRHFAQHQSVRF